MTTTTQEIRAIAARVKPFDFENKGTIEMTTTPATQDRQFKCAGCGNYANDVGSTLCQCATSILVRRSDHIQLVKPYLLHREIEAIAAQREETIAKIRNGLGVAPDDSRQAHSLPGDVGRLVAALTTARDYVDGNHDEGCELDPEFGEQNFDDEDDTRVWPDDRKCTCGTDEILANIDAALTPSALSGDAGEGKVWRIACRDIDDEYCQFNFTTRAECDAFLAGIPKGASVTDIYEGYQHTAEEALSALSTSEKGAKQ